MSSFVFQNYYFSYIVEWVKKRKKIGIREIRDQKRYFCVLNQERSVGDGGKEIRYYNVVLKLFDDFI